LWGFFLPQSPEIASPAFAEPALMKMGGQVLAMTQEPLFTRLSGPLQECPLNARRVPLPAFASTSFGASIFEKPVLVKAGIGSYDPCFWPIFASPK